MTDVTIIIGDKSTFRLLDADSGLGVAPDDRIYVEFTAGFLPGDLVWVTDDNSDGEVGTILNVFLNDYLEMTKDLTALYSFDQHATVILILNISDDIINADTWRDRLTYIGRCKLKLSNVGDKWGGHFDSNDLIVIQINDTILWRGYVDIAKPYLPVKGVATNEMIITGRDDGRRLTDLSFTRESEGMEWAADIVKDIMTLLGDPFLYNDDGNYGTEVEIKFEAIRTKLGDALKEICELSGRDFRIDNNGRLWLFEAASENSGVELDMVAGDPTNNLLTFDNIEVDGYTIKNHIEIHAGSVKGHYDNQGAYLFTDEGGAAKSDEIDPAYFGGSCLKIACTGISRSFLDFAAGVCSYSPSVDLRKSCEAKVRIKGETAVDFFNLQPYARDAGGRVILFTRNGPNILSGKGSPKGWTDSIQDFNDFNHWLTLSYPLGASTSNKVKVNQTTGFWHAVAWDPLTEDFDWEHVERLGFEWPQGDNGFVLLDAWSIPSLEAHAIAQNVPSQDANDIRMDTEFRKELKSQKQLEDYAAAVVLDKKDTIQKFKAVAKGQVGTKYAAQYVTVNVPDYDIIDVEYIITLVHHKVHNNKLTRGWDFLTEYDLVAEIVTGYRVILDDNPMAAMMDKIRRANRGFKGGIEADDILLGDVISGGFTNTTRGATFPTSAATGDIHFLTADIDPGPPVYYGDEGVSYEYDEVTELWYRGPIVMHRDVQPPATGGLIGDTWHDTDNDLWFECIGEDPDDWDPIDFAATSISGEVVADQLAIEQRNWHTSLNFIWDVANKDWNEIWWGEAADEKNTNAEIKFDGATTNVILKGHEAALGDGTYIYYWNDALNPGGPHTLVRDTFANWDNGVGAGRGIVFVVVINDGDTPSFYPFNSYLATAGFGMVSAWTIKTHHLTAELIYGKDIATQIAVGEGGGNAGIRIIGDAADIVGTAIGDAIGGNFTAGIWGFADGPKRTFWLDPATGIMWVYGAGMFSFKTYPGVPGGEVGDVVVGYLDATVWDLGLGGGDQRVLVLKSAVADQIAAIESNGRWFAIDGTSNNAILSDGVGALVPLTDEGVDIGTNLLQFGDIWGTVKYNDLHLLDTRCYRCGELFEMDDDIKFIVIATESLEDSAGTPYDQIRCVPVHSRCSLWDRIKRWFNGIRLGD